MIAGNGTKMKDRWNIVGCVLFCFVVFGSPPASKQKTCVKKKFLTQAGFIQPNRFLIVIGEQFKISFRMQAGRTNFGRSFADMYITAFTAIQADFFRAGKDQIIPYIL